MWRTGGGGESRPPRAAARYQRAHHATRAAPPRAAQHGAASGVFTYWSTRANGRASNKGLRLDYALASRRLMGDNAGGGGAVESAASDGGEAGGGAEGDGAAVARRLPRVHDSFVLDTEYAPISDHAPIGCVVLLPPPASEE
jgi:hypothetical protein